MLPLHAAQKPPVELEQLKTKLTQVKGSLGDLKAGLGALKDKVHELKDKLQGLAGIHTLPAAPAFHPSPPPPPGSPLSARWKRLQQRFRLPTTRIDLTTRLVTPMTQPCNQADLNAVALGPDVQNPTGYGYKTGNLHMLRKLVNQLDQFKDVTGYTIQVPDFVGISSSEIKAFMRKKLNVTKNSWGGITNIPFDIQTIWNDLKDRWARNPPLNDQKKIDEIDATIGQDLKNRFEALSESFRIGAPSLQAIFADTFDQTSEINASKPTLQALEDLLEHCSKINLRLVVRSTGKEDTDSLANAGGNETVINVEPTPLALLNAMQTVVCSYVGKKSLQQRLGAGDPDLFNEPFMPVVVQVMIGEPPLGAEKAQEIPRCGVMFTEEAEGSINKKEERAPGKKINTTGITLIQASYGLNEGVVNSLVPIDSFYIDNTGIIHSVIRNKVYRLVPTEQSGETINQENPIITQQDPQGKDVTINLQTMPALLPKEIVMLKLLANALEQYYFKPMDVEYVIDESKKIIYLVQARPIVHNKDVPEPSYISNVQSDLIKEYVTGESIGTAGGKTHDINQEAEIIVTKTIKEALDHYNALDKPIRKTIKAIIIGTDSPATSHEATTFRGENKPVIYFEDYRKVLQWSKLVDQQTVLIDPQQGLITQLTKTITPGSPEWDELLTNGWKNYPLPKALSVVLKQYLTDQQLLLDKTLSDKIEAVLGIHAAQQKDLIRELTTNPQSFSHLFTELSETSDERIMRTSLTKMLLLLGLSTHKYQKLIDKDIHLSREYDNLINHFLWCAEHIILTKLSTLPDIQKLFPLRMLEALLFQGIEGTILHRSSFLNFLGYLKNLKATLKTSTPTTGTVALPKPVQPPTPPTRHQMILSLAKDYILNPVIGERWTNFVSQLTPEENSRLAKLILGLAPHNIFLQWLHTEFPKNYDPSQPAQHCLTELERTFSKAQTFLTDLMRYRTKLTALNLDYMEKPEQFFKLWDKFNEIINYVTTPKFMDSIATSKDIITLLAATSFLEEFIAKFDSAIKSVEASKEFVIDATTNIIPSYTGENITERLKKAIRAKNKLAAVKFLLIEYLAVLEKWYGSASYQLPTFYYYSHLPAPTPLSSLLVEQEKRNLNFLHNNTPNQALDTSKKTLLNEATTDEKTLKAHETFSVAEALFGSQGNWDRGQPRNMEEIFTFTHQNLLVLLGIITKRCFEYSLESGYLSEAIKIINSNLKSNFVKKLLPSGYSTPQISLAGIQMHHASISLTYNIPLNNHSALLKIIYNAHKKMVFFTLSMVGANHYNRWADCADYAATLSKLLTIKNDINLYPREIEAQWEVSTSIEIKDVLSTRLIPLINNLIEISNRVETLTNTNTLTLLKGQTDNLRADWQTNNLFIKMQDIKNFEDYNNEEKVNLLITLTDLSLDRIILFLPPYLDYCIKNPNPLEIPPDKNSVIKKLINCLKELLNTQSPYVKKTQIFIIKKTLAPELGSLPQVPAQITAFNTFNIHNFAYSYGTLRITSPDTTKASDCFSLIEIIHLILMFIEKHWASLSDENKKELFELLTTYKQNRPPSETTMGTIALNNTSPAATIVNLLAPWSVLNKEIGEDPDIVIKPVEHVHSPQKYDNVKIFISDQPLIQLTKTIDKQTTALVTNTDENMKPYDLGINTSLTSNQPIKEWIKSYITSLQPGWARIIPPLNPNEPYNIFIRHPVYKGNPTPDDLSSTIIASAYTAALATADNYGITHIFLSDITSGYDRDKMLGIILTAIMNYLNAPKNGVGNVTGIQEITFMTTGDKKTFFKLFFTTRGSYFSQNNTSYPYPPQSYFTILKIPQNQNELMSPPVAPAFNPYSSQAPYSYQSPYSYQAPYSTPWAAPRSNRWP